MLTDTSAIVALIAVGDSHHKACAAVYRHLSAPELVTTWPCITESMHMLGKRGGFTNQSKLWELRASGQLIIHEPTSAEIDRMEVLMAKYADLPMDLADASLVALAEYKSMKQIFSCDSDFYVYQLADGTYLEVLPGPTV